MRQSTKFIIPFLTFSVVLGFPQEAKAGKKWWEKGDLGRVVKAVQGDKQAAAGLPGDIRKVALAISGDDEARAKLRTDWANAKAKLRKLAGEDTEEAATAGAGVPGGSTSEDPTQADLDAVIRRISALEAARSAPAPETDAILRARIAALEAELASRPAAAPAPAATVPTNDPTAVGSSAFGASLPGSSLDPTDRTGI